MLNFPEAQYHVHYINHTDFENETNVQQLQCKRTFLTPLIIPFVNEQVARALWEPRQGEKLQEGRDTRGGEQDGPVLFSPQDLSVKSHRFACT